MGVRGACRRARAARVGGALPDEQRPDLAHRADRQRRVVSDRRAGRLRDLDFRAAHDGRLLLQGSRRRGQPEHRRQHLLLRESGRQESGRVGARDRHPLSGRRPFRRGQPPRHRRADGLRGAAVLADGLQREALPEDSGQHHLPGGRAQEGRVGAAAGRCLHGVPVRRREGPEQHEPELPVQAERAAEPEADAVHGRRDGHARAGDRQVRAGPVVRQRLFAAWCRASRSASR